MRKKVLITEAVSDVGLNFLRENGYELVIGTGPSEATLLKECPDCDGALTRNGKFTAQVFDACPKLKVVSMHGIGVDGIDVDAATVRGIQVCNAAFGGRVRHRPDPYAGQAVSYLPQWAEKR